MNRNFILCILVTFSLISNSCKKNTCCSIAALSGSWINIADIDSNLRSGAISFVIDDAAYIGFGVNGNGHRLNDLWRFDTLTTNWFQLANCNGIGRSSAVGFSVNGKGYVATGYDGSNMLNDTWQYDPSSNNWAQKANFPGTNRFDAVAFAIGNYGWVGTGYDGSDRNDFFKYDPSSDTWIQEMTCPGYARSGAISFVYHDSAYLVTGQQNNGLEAGDFWRFDPNLNDSLKWRQLRHIYDYSPDSYDDSYTSIERYKGVGFVLLNTKSNGGGDRAYIATGAWGNGFSSAWGYNFATDVWYQVDPIAPWPIQGAVGFSVDNKGFVTTGILTASEGEPLNGIIEFFPDR